MATYKGPQKGKADMLVISQDANRRFFVGLSWDPKDMPRVDINIPKKPAGGFALFLHYILWPFNFIRILYVSLMKLIATDMYVKTVSKSEDGAGLDKSAKHFDLDLSCYIFDAQGALLHVVGPENAAFIDPSRKVYHSGEDQAGFGGPDDEVLSVETLGLPHDYHHFFFVVKSDSQYSLEEIRNPAIRLADGKLNENILESDIKPPAHYNARGFVFCHVWRSGDGFMFRNLDEYTGFEEDWVKLLLSFVDAKAA